MISAYHPQTYSQIEIVNKYLQTYLRSVITNKKNKWFKWLDLPKWCYNSSYHTSAKMTPFQALYGNESLEWKELANSLKKVRFNN